MVKGGGGTFWQGEAFIPALQIKPYVYVLISVAESFGMTKIHKEIAMHMMECVQDEKFTDQATVKVSTPKGYT